jgi:hypothetical protein
MPVVVAIICSLALLCLAAFQVALLLGAPLARFAWGGADHYLQPQFRRGAVLTVVFDLVAVFVVLQGANVFLVLPVLASQLATYLFTAIFFVLFVMAARSPSAAERRVMLPANLILAALFLIVAIAGHS